MLALNLGTMDIGFGTTLFTKNLYVGVSPFSINWTQSPGYGISILSKFKLDRFVLEGKLTPYSYNEIDFSIIDYNSYLGLQYWFNKDFSLGLRFHRYDFYSHYNLMVSWNLI